MKTGISKDWDTIDADIIGGSIMWHFWVPPGMCLGGSERELEAQFARCAPFLLGLMYSSTQAFWSSAPSPQAIATTELLQTGCTGAPVLHMYNSTLVEFS